jgi:hypothetical protein
MKGARAVLLVTTMSNPNSSRINTIGASQSFLRTFRKIQNSLSMPILLINRLQISVSIALLAQDKKRKRRSPDKT